MADDYFGMANKLVGVLRSRDSPSSAQSSPPPPGPTMAHSTLNLILILLVLLVLALFLAGGLLCWRHYWRYRAAQDQSLPLHNTHEKRFSTASASRRHRRVMDRPGQSPYLFQDKQALLSQHDSPSPPPSPVPEIRVTLPEELVDGKRHSGRVVVLRVGSMGSEGLEPIPEEQLPPYNDAERFHSLDLESVGGLMEKPGLTPPPPGWRRQGC